MNTRFLEDLFFGFILPTAGTVTLIALVSVIVGLAGDGFGWWNFNVSD